MPSRASTSSIPSYIPQRNTAESVIGTKGFFQNIPHRTYKERRKTNTNSKPSLGHWARLEPYY